MHKILAIDDKEDNLTTVSAVLKNTIPDCQLITALSGFDGIQLAKSESPDVILLDIIMPKMDGFETCRQLKNDDKTRHIPVVLLTAIKTDSDSRIKGLEIGADAFLGKPIDPAEFAAQVKVMLRIKKAEDLLRQDKKLLEEEVEKRTKDLRESEKRFSLFMESATEGFVLFDSELNYIIINQTALEIFPAGTMKKNIIGKNILEIAPGLEKTGRYKEYLKVIKTGKPIFFEDLVPHPKFSKRSISLRAFKVGEGLGMIFSDITEKKHAQEQIKNQNIMLEKAVRKKQQEMELLMDRLIRQEKLAVLGQISGSIAHELRNPLSVIKQSIYFLNHLRQTNRLESSGTKVKEHFDLLTSEINESNKVISDLLQMTRMEPLLKKKINLRSVILNVLNRFPLDKRTQLNVSLKPEPFLIWADQLQLRQVLINLLSNATYDINKKRIVTISGNILNQDKKCSIKIEDDGPGIPPENLEKVFEPLFTSKVTGIGLGLSICKRIIANHDGTITLTSKVGKGTTVSIELPNENG